MEQQQLRVALASYRSHPFCGGQGIYVSYLSRALRKLGHQVTVISGEPYPDLDKGIKLVKLPGMNFYAYPTAGAAVRDRGLKSLSDRIEHLGYVTGGFPEMYTFGRRLAQYMKKNGHQYDLVHDNQSLGYGLLNISRRGIPVVSTIHHPITKDLALALAQQPDWLSRLLVRRWHAFLMMQKRVAPKISRLITVSRRAKKDISKDFKVSGKKIDVVYNGVDSDTFAPMPSITPKPFRIMATASADVPLKGLLFLLKAVARLAGSFPETDLMVLGKPKSGGSIETLIRSLGIENRVRFVSGLSTQEITACYARATVTVVPSLYEGFGLPAAEAMACGCPVISTTGGALPEVVGDCGLLVPPGDEIVLANTIARIFSDPSQRARLSRAGRIRMKQKFNWEQAATRTVEVYCKAISRRRQLLSQPPIKNIYATDGMGFADTDFRGIDHVDH